MYIIDYSGVMFNEDEVNVIREVLNRVSLYKTEHTLSAEEVVLLWEIREKLG
jgi:hypothetical protein